MFVDMHCHSVSSDDSRATVEQYLKWIQVLRKRGRQIDGIVLTEHRKFDVQHDYGPLASQYGVVVLKGSELDTRHGHFLVYGVNERLLREVNFADVAMNGVELVRSAKDCGAIAVPAHPGRLGIGFCEYVVQEPDFSGVEIVEYLNGGSRQGENERGQALANQRNLVGIGGSDAHFSSGIAVCLTEFPRAISNEAELVEALAAKQFRPLRLEDTSMVQRTKG